jgi:hypothetical protein
MNIFQLIVGYIIIIVLFFGLSFILNMLIKTTYMPVFLYILFIIGLMLYDYFNNKADEVTIGDYLAEFGIIDVTFALFGLVGVLGGGLAIRKLRKLGYKMF